MSRSFCSNGRTLAFRTHVCGWLLIWMSSAALAQTAKEWTNRADQATDPAQAEQYYTKALQLQPNADETLLGRAIVRGRLGRYQDGVSDVSAAIALNDTAARYYAQRAYLLVQLSDYDPASADYERAIKLSPRDARYYSGLSYCRVKQNRLPEALTNAQKGIALNPNSPYPYRNRGRVWLGQGKIDQAITDFQNSLNRKHAEPYRVLTDLGEAYELKKEYAKAFDYYRQALALKPAYADAEVRQQKLLKNKLVSVANPKPASIPDSKSTFTGKRVALVIGNSEYETIEPHLNGQPEADAKAINTRLTELGFTSIIKLNTDTQALRDELNSFYEKAKDADLVFFYFAGHGLQYNGSNYLLPIDIELTLNQQEADYAARLTKQALLLTTVIERLQKCYPRYCLIVLDACREDPLKDLKKSSSTVSDSATHFIPMPFVPIVVENYIRNCCVAQATTAGSRAWNGSGRNGCYTEALLRYLLPGRLLEQSLKRVRNDVLEMSKKAGKQQSPEFLDQTSDDLIF